MGIAAPLRGNKGSDTAERFYCQSCAALGRWCQERNKQRREKSEEGSLYVWTDERKVRGQWKDFNKSLREDLVWEVVMGILTMDLLFNSVTFPLCWTADECKKTQRTHKESSSEVQVCSGPGVSFTSVMCPLWLLCFCVFAVCLCGEQTCMSEAAKSVSC